MHHAVDNVDAALEDTPSVEHVVVLRRVGEEVRQISMKPGRDLWWNELLDQHEGEIVEHEHVDAEHGMGATEGTPASFQGHTRNIEPVCWFA